VPDTETYTLINDVGFIKDSGQTIHDEKKLNMLSSLGNIKELFSQKMCDTEKLYSDVTPVNH